MENKEKYLDRINEYISDFSNTNLYVRKIKTLEEKLKLIEKDIIIVKKKGKV